jgi:hypothetical protein
MTYSLQGSRLAVAGPSDEKAPGELPGLEVAFDGEHMTVTGETTKTRIGTAVAGSPPIVGVWTYQHYTGVSAFERYGVDGTMDLRITMPGETRGRFAVADSTLTMETGGKKSVKSFVLSGDLLTLTSGEASGGRSRTYRRTSAWYVFPLPESDLEKMRAKLGIPAQPRKK